MARVTILGAGDMGTALATPLARNGHEIALWGTERDGDIVTALHAGLPHPRLQVATPPNVVVYAAHEASAALEGAEVVVVAVTSDAVRPVLKRLGSHLGQPRAVVTVAKGFDAGPDGRLAQLLPDTFGEVTDRPLVAVGGPAKANEVALGQPTGAVFGSPDPTALSYAQALFQTQDYHVASTSDLVGVEICAAMKNAYAIGLGMTDGLERRSGRPHHNLRAALFPMAVSEMAALATLVGGEAETAHGLAGAGDLLVTITSGRNRLLGERVGLGEPPLAAVQALAGRGTTIEGYPAVAFGHRLRGEGVKAGSLPDGSLPLLDAIWRIVYRGADPGPTLAALL